MIQGLSHIQLIVRDVPSAARWFADVLELLPLTSGETADGPYTALRHPEAGFVVGLSTQPAQAPPPTATAVDHISFAVRDLDALRAWHDRARGNGHEPGGIFTEAVSHNTRITGPEGLVIEITAPR